METGLNLVILQGKPTADPEIKETTTGRVMCKTWLAVNRPYLGQNAPKQTDYFDVIAFGELGQNIYTNLGKGATCTIVGRVEQSEFITRNGDKREKYSIVANRIVIHEWKGRSSKARDEMIEELDIPREIADSVRAVTSYDEDMPDYIR